MKSGSSQTALYFDQPGPLLWCLEIGIAETGERGERMEKRRHDLHADVMSTPMQKPRVTRHLHAPVV